MHKLFVIVATVTLLMGQASWPQSASATPYEDTVKACIGDQSGRCRNTLLSLPELHQCDNDSDCTPVSWRVCGCPAEEAVNKKYVSIYPQGEIQFACLKSCDPDKVYIQTSSVSCVQHVCMRNQCRFPDGSIKSCKP